MTIKTYQQAIKYLETFIKPVVFEKISQKEARLKDPLDRMRKLLELLDNPQDKFKSVLIGGTSGKGSTAYFISHIFKTAGYKTGLTISPHLQKVNERIQINGVQISNEDFISLLNEIIPAIAKMTREEILRFAQDDKGKVQDDNLSAVGEPSYFEILVAMAFLYFNYQKIDIAVVEVGMGGRYDATNTLNPLISVITNVSLDHTDILGRTVEKIAREKVGIVKSRGPVIGFLPVNARLSLAASRCERLRVAGSPSTNATPLYVITCVRQKSVIKIVEEKSKEVGAKLYRLGKDFTYKIKRESIEGTEFDLTTPSGRPSQLNDLKLTALGGYQVENASLAVKTVLELQKFGFKISEQNIRKALSTSFFPGRFEIVKVAGPVSLHPHPMSSLAPLTAGTRWGSPPLTTRKNRARGTRGTRDTLGTLILDGAHNLAKMKAFLTSLKKIYRTTHKIFIVAFKDDKDAKGMLKEIMKVADIIIVTQFHRKIEVKGHGTMDRSKIKDQIRFNRNQRSNPIQSDSKIKKDTKIYYANSSREALERAIGISRRLPRFLSVARNDESISLIVITGSLYLVGEIRSLIFTSK